MSRLRINELPRIEGPRYFCIGFNKTGTTTMKKCFEKLGLTPVATSWDTGHLASPIFKHNDYAPALAAASRFASFQDRPWNTWNMYKVLDAAFDHSYFILTYRDPESWYRSVHHWLNVTHRERVKKKNIYKQHLKVDSDSKEAMIGSYIQYNNEAKRYFADRGDFLVMNFEEGDGWEKLCRFLNLEVPEAPFPHVNRQRYNR